jgi:hypothetical protein
MSRMAIECDASALCEHGYEPGVCSLCDEATADLYEPVQRLRDYLAVHPELDAEPGLLQGVPLS